MRACLLLCGNCGSCARGVMCAPCVFFSVMCARCVLCVLCVQCVLSVCVSAFSVCLFGGGSWFVSCASLYSSILRVFKCSVCVLGGVLFS